MLIPIIFIIGFLLCGFFYIKGFNRGREVGYVQGWYDHLIRDDFARSMSCSYYWKYQFDLCNSDLKKRKKYELQEVFEY